MRTLLHWRLRHVAGSAYRLLMRRWQATLLLALLLSPRDMPLRQQLQVLAHPVLVLVTPGPPGPVLSNWLILLGLALAWARVQGDVIGGGPAWSYARTLPIAPRTLRRVDLAVLAVCDLPLLLPFLAALTIVPPVQAIAVIVAAAQLPLVQWLAAQRPALAAIAVGLQLAGLWLLATGLTPAPFIAACVAATAVTLRRAEVPSPPRPLRAAKARRPMQLPAAAPVWARLAAIDLRGLLALRLLPRHLSLVACALLPWLLRVELRAEGLRTEVVTTVVVLSMLPLVFGVSGLAFDLRRMHEPMQPLHASLGVPARLLRTVDMAVLLALFLPGVLPLARAAWLESGSARALVVVPLSALALLACAALNFRGDRGIVLPKALACGVAAGGSLYWMLG